MPDIVKHVVQRTLENNRAAYIRAQHAQGFETLFTEAESLGFSWSPCPCCQDYCGGERYELRGLIKDERSNVRTSEHIGDVCQSCMQYIEQ